MIEENEEMQYKHCLFATTKTHSPVENCLLCVHSNHPLWGSWKTLAVASNDWNANEQMKILIKKQSRSATEAATTRITTDERCIGAFSEMQWYCLWITGCRTKHAMRWNSIYSASSETTSINLIWRDMWKRFDISYPIKCVVPNFKRNIL